MSDINLLKIIESVISNNDLDSIIINSQMKISIQCGIEESHNSLR